MGCIFLCNSKIVICNSKISKFAIYVLCNRKCRFLPLNNPFCAIRIMLETIGVFYGKDWRPGAHSCIWTHCHVNKVTYCCCCWKHNFICHLVWFDWWCIVCTAYFNGGINGYPIGQPYGRNHTHMLYNCKLASFHPFVDFCLRI